jgi:hypothetical protein
VKCIAGPVEVVILFTPPAPLQFFDKMIAKHLEVEFTGRKLPDKTPKTPGKVGHHEKIPF